jgi:CRISPR-associated protein Cas2
MKNWHMITYDIRDDKRLRKVARIMEGYGVRIQYSVFRCHLSERQVERLRWEIACVTESNDDMMIVRLCPHCVARLRNSNPKVNWPETPERWHIL